MCRPCATGTSPRMRCPRRVTEHNPEGSAMSKKKFVLMLVVCAAVALGYEGGRLAPISSSQAQTASVQTSTGTLPDFSALVEQNGPAVVNISTTTAPVRTQMQLPQIPGEPGDPMQEFFRRFQIPMPQGDAIRRGVGSGFIVSADGYILTNAHVVDDASEVTVKLTDKREFKAKVIGVDRRTDVALVKIDSKNLPTVRIGDASKARVGEWVAAIGSPFGLENTVTAGIISAKSRSLPDETYVPFIQTDVAINPGNSGGPLFNMAGEVIGINSPIYSRTDGYMGLSFALPIDLAMKGKTHLPKSGKLGLAVRPLTQEERKQIEADGGLLVEGSEGPAARAGVQAGDVILAFNNQPVKSVDQLRRLVDRSRGSVALLIQREGNKIYVPIRLS